ncbi:MAG TPA: LLM class flavin-dependent oxidoreductase [Candidatus Dormibacteraeota bacterium]|jgi:5,10-methylenetetrahydromethanopterin reductase|nr:LLM class flavin-dependent oxidoreductase [Candidatus Dormibacteraeota bacterium]
MKVGLGFLGGPDLRTLVAAGQAAERAGFESLWHAETRITRDSVTALTALALGTDRARIGSAAINVYTRGAALTAITWAALAEAAPGRVVLGLGPGSPGPLAQQGHGFDFPVSRLREFVAAVRATWTAPSPISHPGRFVRLAGLVPEVRPPAPIPIYLCVTGPRALDCAGAIADGVILNAFMPAAYTQRARTRLDRVAGAGGFRGEVGQAMVVAVADSVAEAAARVRPLLAGYLVHFPNLAAETGLDPELLDRLRGRARRGGLEATFDLLPDELVSRHALVGPEPECRERLEEYRAAGLDLPVLFPDPADLGRVIRGLRPVA